ncbi:MAG: ATP-binding protein [Bacteroidetes bacterium]|nr:ATP-binding protein [Bacteroidota bacterium]
MERTKSPFQFGRIVEGNSFTDRTKEIARLVSNFENRVHTILISPRRWGKSSLVKKAAGIAQDKNPNLRFCFIDLFSIRNEEEFYTEFAKQVIRATSGKVEEWIETGKNLFSRLTPRFSFGSEPLADFEVSFDMKELIESFDEILNLPEQVSAKKNVNLVICLDEFQNLSNFSDPDLFQKRLRAIFQHHQAVAYCFYGSKRHMLSDIFENQSMPFYKFGDVIYLEKIPGEDLTNFIVSGFEQTGKSISPALAGNITGLMKRHPYYTQQLSYITWINTERVADEKTVETAVDDLLRQNGLLYMREVDALSNTQVNFLKAVADEVKELTSAVTLQQYQIGTSANVVKIRETLEKREIIDSNSDLIEFIDPAFELWFRRYFYSRSKGKL